MRTRASRRPMRPRNGPAADGCGTRRPADRAPAPGAGRESWGAVARGSPRRLSPPMRRRQGRHSLRSPASTSGIRADASCVASSPSCAERMAPRRSRWVVTTRHDEPLERWPRSPPSHGFAPLPAIEPFADVPHRPTAQDGVAEMPAMLAQQRPFHQLHAEAAGQDHRLVQPAAAGPRIDLLQSRHVEGASRASSTATIARARGDRRCRRTHECCRRRSAPVRPASWTGPNGAG